MPLYEVGRMGGGDSSTFRSVHKHAKWETPVAVINNQVFKVSQGNYLEGSLDVAISAEVLGEEGYTLVFPPAYAETDPSEGLLTLTQELPVGWKFMVRYSHQ